jgi:Zn-dependent metalloprotease
MAVLSPNRRKFRQIYDARQSDQLPGILVRSEGEPNIGDAAADSAYDGAGDTYDFYDQIFQRNSLDDNGMTLISSVHVAEVDDIGQLVPMNNAFWDGEQMAYGDGDGVIFQPFTQSLDVIGHELTHGVQSFTSKTLHILPNRAHSTNILQMFLVYLFVSGRTMRQWRRPIG